MVQIADFGGFADIFKRDPRDPSLLENITGGIKDIRTQNVVGELATPGISEKNRKAAMLRLMTIDRNVGQAVSTAMQRGDSRVLAQQVASAEKATKLANFFSTLSGDNQVAQIRKSGQEALAKGDFRAAEKLFDLSKMTPGERKAAIVKQQVVGQDVATSAKFAQGIIAKREQEELNVARNVLALPEDQRAQAVFQLEQDALARGDRAAASNLNRLRRRPEEITPSLQAVIARAEPQKTTTAAAGSALIRGGQIVGQVPAAPNKPLSPEGKTAFDIKNGFITKAQADSGDFEVSKLNPNDFTPESWAIATSPGGSSRDLRPSELAKQKADRGEFATGGAFIIRNPDQSNSLVVPVTNKRTGETTQNISKLGGPIVARGTGETVQELEERTVRTAGRKTRAERMAVINTQADLTNVQRRTKRDLDNIDSAIQAAENVPRLQRNLELLQTIETGGIDAIVLAAARTLGVESGDQAELTFNLRTNVLKQLKPTFGAQFTEREGKLLAEIQASETKSTAGNIRLMKRAIEIYNRAIERGIRGAERQGDDAALEDIEAFLEPLASLQVESGGIAPPRAEKTFNPETGLLE